jgi:hypothetical protein
MRHIVPRTGLRSYPSLRWALYSRRRAFELLEGTSWQVESLHDPEKFIQHYFGCCPA